MNTQWTESTNKLNDRKAQLKSMLDECRTFEENIDSFSSKLNDIEQKVDAMQDISFGTDTLKKQKAEHKVKNLNYYY